MFRARLLVPLLPLAGCVAPSSGPAPLAAPAAPTFNLIGLDGVMGHNASALQGLFGAPELDVREGAARKLQFVGPACVLDAYFYPGRSGADPVVSWIDTRMPDGRDIDRASCVAALTRRQEAR